ncbi:hypothetical protein DH2020_044538 [Rehmannia glutinosa]|uniref:Uncharacterized protein n=1 Tax=Rehmannia glutinosa TaxID=99300 RepID=A0ABR0UHG0_REHGL
MCDSLQQAVNYIKDMQNNIYQLRSQRDNMLKKKSAHDQIGKSKNSKLDNLSNFTVTVNHFPDGVEILIETEFEAKQGFPPSRILRELLQRGFNIVSCVSTRTDEKRSLHRIQLEASNLTFKDLSGLQERLTHVMNCTNGSC